MGTPIFFLKKIRIPTGILFFLTKNPIGFSIFSQKKYEFL